MSDFQLNKIAKIFETCFRDAGVFERDVPGQNLIETDILRRAGEKWIVVAGGIDQGEADELFPSTSKRAERAGTGVTITRGGDISFLFVVRPVTFPITEHSPLTSFGHFAPGDDVPLIEWRTGYLRLWNLPDKGAQLRSLRWELEIVPARRDPVENWLRSWASILHHNPAHPPFHLHINSLPIAGAVGGDPRDEISTGDMRFAVGVPNPLSMILSLASWLRAV